jgi:hypothetical protein
VAGPGKRSAAYEASSRHLYKTKLPLELPQLREMIVSLLQARTGADVVFQSDSSGDISRLLGAVAASSGVEWRAG